MTNMRPLAPGITCPGCQRKKFLPLQSPLGIFLSLESPPTGEWPAVFVCTVCGRVSEHLWPPDDYVVPAGRTPDLWRIECVCDHEGCEMRHAIYTTYDAGLPEEDVMRTLVRLSKPVPCMNHDFRLSARTIEKLERVVVP
jgi:hypothetical protein